MTVAVFVAGLLPIMLGGGMVTAPLLSMLVLPAAYLLLHRRELRRPLPLGH